MRITPEAVNLAEKFIRSDSIAKALARQVHVNQLDHMMHDVSFRTAELILENQSACQEQKKWASRVLPCIAFYETMITETGSRESALMFFEAWTQSVCKPASKSLLSRISFPRLFRRTNGNSAPVGHHSPKQVFCSHSGDCLCSSLCRKYGCPEITRFMCVCCTDTKKTAVVVNGCSAAHFQDARLMSKE